MLISNTLKQFKVYAKSVDCILILQSDVFFNTVHQKQIIIICLTLTVSFNACEYTI